MDGSTPNYKVGEGSYVLPKFGYISHKNLVKQLEPNSYQTVWITAGLWNHKKHPINFTLVVNNFVAKYAVKEHSLQMKTSCNDNKCTFNHIEALVNMEIWSDGISMIPDNPKTLSCQSTYVEQPQKPSFLRPHYMESCPYTAWLYATSTSILSASLLM